ncbi:hypothetical protein GCM10017776_37880 [Streptomyces griseoluteus]|nr:hypothetical protein GCM10017776_37880 [Streptomyces griseoluteus]
MLSLQPMRGSPARTSVPPVGIVFMVVFPPLGPRPEDTECQMPWRLRKLGRCDTLGRDSTVTCGDGWSHN